MGPEGPHKSTKNLEASAVEEVWISSREFDRSRNRAERFLLTGYVINGFLESSRDLEASRGKDEGNLPQGGSENLATGPPNKKGRNKKEIVEGRTGKDRDKVILVRIVLACEAIGTGFRGKKMVRRPVWPALLQGKLFTEED